MPIDINKLQGKSGIDLEVLQGKKKPVKPQPETKRQQAIRRYVDESENAKDPFTRQLAKTQLAGLKGDEKAFADKARQTFKPTENYSTREALLAGITAPLGGASLTGKALTGLAAKGGTVGKVANVASKATNAPGWKGMLGRTGAAAGQNALANVEFNTLTMLPNAMSDPKQTAQDWKSLLVPSAQGGAALGGGIHLGIELLTRGKAPNATMRPKAEPVAKAPSRPVEVPVEAPAGAAPAPVKPTPAQTSTPKPSTAKPKVEPNRPQTIADQLAVKQKRLDRVNELLDKGQGRLDDVTFQKLLDESMTLHGQVKSLSDEAARLSSRVESARAEYETLRPLLGYSSKVPEKGRGAYKVVSGGKVVQSNAGYADVSEVAGQMGMQPEQFRRWANDILKGREYTVIPKGGVASSARRAGEITDTVTTYELNILKRHVKGLRGVDEPELKITVDPDALPKYAGNINLTRIKSPKAVKEQILKTVEEMTYDPKQADRYRRITWAETEQAARDLGLTIDDVKKIRPGQAFNAAETTALRDMNVYYAKKVKQAEKAYLTGETPETKAAFLEAISEHQALIAATRGAAAEAGRTLQIYNKLAEARTSARRLVGGDLFEPIKNPIPPSSKVYGSRNTLFTKARAEAAKARFLEKTSGRLNANVDPTLLLDVIEMGGYHFEAGLREFGAWSAQMASDLGDGVKPYLKDAWDKLKQEAATRRGKTLEAKDVAYQKIYDLYGGEKEVNQMLIDIAKIPDDDTTALTKYLWARSKYKTSDKVQAYLYSNMLSSPRTQIMNTTSNMLWAAQQLPMRLVRGAIDRPMARIQGRPREYYMRETVPAALGLVQGVPEGLRRALYLVKNGFDLSDASKVEVPKGYQFRGGMANPLNWGSRLLLAADAVAKESARSSKIYADAARQGLKEGLSGEKLSKRIADLRANPTDEMVQKADAFAGYSTFTGEPDVMLRTFTRWRSAVKIPDDVPVVGGFEPLRLVVPFVQVPYNILKSGAEYSPAGIGALTRKSIRQSPEASTVIAKSVIGSTMMAWALSKASGGEVTGKAPESPSERDAFYAEGKQPYSVKVGDKWIPWNRLGPQGLVFAMASGVTDAFREKEDIPNFTRAGEMVAVLGRYIVDNSYFSGLSSLMDAMDDPERYGERFLASIASQAVPMSGAMRTAANATDPYLRSPEGLYDRIKAGLPILSQDVDPKLNVYGEPSERKAGQGLSFLLPYTNSQPENDPVRLELARLELTPGYGGKNLTIENEKRKLSQDEWQEYQKAIGQARYEAASRIMNAPYYSKIKDEQRERLLKKVMDQAADLARQEFKRSLR